MLDATARRARSTGVEDQERRATRDFLDGDYGPRRGRLPEPASQAARAIPSSAKVAAYHLLDCANRTVGEREPFALVDVGAMCARHGGSYGSEETSRLALESVVSSTLTGGST